MKLKIDENGHVVVQDGNPVYVHEDGKEVAFDAPGTVATISRLNGEAKTHREAKEAAETKLKEFEGLDDPKAAIKALGVVKNLDDKKLVDAGEVDRVKAEAIKAVEDKYKPMLEKAEKLERELFDEKIGGAFARSPLIVGDKAKVAVPSDMIQARFGQNFKIEEGKVAAYDSNGNKIYSRARPGEAADFDEALDILIDQYPYKDHILKGAGGGSGARQSNGSGGAKTISRAEYEANPEAAAAKLSEGYRITE